MSSTSDTTVHYAQPHAVTASPNSSHESRRSPHIRYPKVLVPHVSASQASASPSSVSYAVPFARPVPYSSSLLQCEHMKHRCKMLDEENQRLMRIQGDIVNDANHRVEMHVTEIRVLKEENKKLAQGNKELRDLCCFLDDDRQKMRKLAREWQKFGRYTSNLMKQEVNSYNQKQTELEERLAAKEQETEELKQLCLYLDEQRQILGQQTRLEEEESEDLGCGSSERSSASSDGKESTVLNKHKEHALRMICEQMHSSTTDEPRKKDISLREDSNRILNYIQSLENRIQHLEMTQNNDEYWQPNSNVPSECDEKTIIERWDEKSDVIEELNTKARVMLASTSSTMTSSGTTYGSSETDGESAVYVMGDEIDIGNLEVRSLSRIDEESELRKSRSDAANDLPPSIAPISNSLLSVARLSSNDSTRNTTRASSEICRPTISLNFSSGSRCASVEKSSNISVKY